MTPLEIRPLESAAAEVVGADLTALTVGDWNQLRAAFAAFGLLVFRDQILDEQDHKDFARRWGTPRAHPSESAQPGALSSDEEPGFWCAPGSYLAQPPLGTVEVVQEVPQNPIVQFASAYRAYDLLASVTQRALESLAATHEHDGESADHPVVIRHPISGRASLFVNPSYTTSIVDMDENAGLEVLNQLNEHILSEDARVSIEWEPGTVIVSDGRALLRFAQHSNTGGKVRAISLEGCALEPAVRPKKRDPSLTERAGATLAGGILTAAMTGIAEVIDPERTTHDIEIVSEAPERQPLTGLDFGDLDPLY